MARKNICSNARPAFEQMFFLWLHNEGAGYAGKCLEEKIFLGNTVDNSCVV